MPNYNSIVIKVVLCPQLIVIFFHIVEKSFSVSDKGHRLLFFHIVYSLVSIITIDLTNS